MPLRVGRKPAGEVVERVVPRRDRPRHRGAQPGLRLDEAGAGAGEVGRQHLGPQPHRGEIEAVPRRAQMPFRGKPQPFGAIIEALRRVADQILRRRQSAR